MTEPPGKVYSINRMILQIFSASVHHLNMAFMNKSGLPCQNIWPKKQQIEFGVGHRITGMRSQLSKQD